MKVSEDRQRNGRGRGRGREMGERGEREVEGVEGKEGDLVVKYSRACLSFVYARV
jgi:hypothetical protein